MSVFGLFLALAIVVMRQLGRDIRTVRRLAPGAWWNSPITRAGLTFVLLFTVPLAFVEWAPWAGALGGDPRVGGWAAAVLALLISYTWYRYLTWLDTFERERMRWELAVFLAACLITPLTFKAGPFIIGSFGLSLGSGFFGDLAYTVVGIGLVEESIKLVPLLLVIFLTRQADEPFDLILYGSISALGFAFIENAIYLQRTGLVAVGGRALYASVAHMFFTSVIAYSMALARVRGRPLLPALLVGLVLASIGHGFYDLWLMTAHGPALFTVLFYLASIHLWVVMKNNLINLSPHYTEQMRPHPVMFRYRMINALLAIMMGAFTLKFLLNGREGAMLLLETQGPTMGATMLYLSISLSGFRFIPGYVAPLRPKGGLWRLLLPVVHDSEDHTGRRLLMRIPEQRPDKRHYMALHRMLPLEGRLTQRVLMDDDRDWYLFRPDRPVPFTDAHNEALLVRAQETLDTIPDDRYVAVAVAAFAGPPAFRNGRADKDQLEYVGHVHGKLL